LLIFVLSVAEAHLKGLIPTNQIFSSWKKPEKLKTKKGCPKMSSLFKSLFFMLI